MQSLGATRIRGRWLTQWYTYTGARSGQRNTAL